MIWDTIEISKLELWIKEKQSSCPPPTSYELIYPSPLQALLQNPAVEPVKKFLDLEPRSGTVRFDVSALRSARHDEEVMTFALALAGALDRRRAFFWTGLNPEELGGPAGTPKIVAMEYWFEVDGMRPVGPGGRISYYPRRQSVEILLRRRGSQLGGSWRNSRELANCVASYLEVDQIPSVRLRGAFGYYEGSRYQRQTVLRPVFLFLLDRPTVAEGPRWRVATTLAATDLPNAAATAGIEAVAGCA